MPVNIAQKKKLEFKIDNKTYEVKKRSIKTQNVTAPQKDSFFGLRALEIQDAREPMARFFIRRRDLENTDLIINTNYLPLPNEKNIIAFYSDENGSINYNKFYDFAQNLLLQIPQATKPNTLGNGTWMPETQVAKPLTLQ